MVQAAVLVINETKLEIFVNKSPVSLFHLHLKMYNSSLFWRKSIWPSSSAPIILFFLREILQIESIRLLYFEGIWR